MYTSQQYLEELQIIQRVQGQGLKPDIKKVRHIDKLKSLGLPSNKCVIVSSGVLALYGIRQNDDLDISVTKDLFFKVLRLAGYKVKLYNATKESWFPTNYPVCQLFDGDIEIGFRSFTAPVPQLIEEANNVKGVNFLNLNRLIEWKKAINRPKDLKDIKNLKKVFNVIPSDNIVKNIVGFDSPINRKVY